MTQKTYAVYLRKSRAEELTDSTAEVLARHREILQALAERMELEVSAVYEEVVSGESLAAREQMQRLLSGVRAGQFAGVLCMDIDRLGRGGMADQGTILDAFRLSETKIITPDKIYDLNDESDEELTEFKAFMARREYKIIRKRMTRGLMQTVRSGGYVANPPYGYRKVRIGKLPSLEIVEDEARFVRLAFDRYCEGVGAHVIAQELNALGSVPRRNGTWVQSTVRQLLRNPTYKGMIAWNRVKHFKPGSHGQDRHHVVHMKEEDWILVPGLHPAIIEPEQWDRVQQIRKEKWIPPNYTGQIANPFSGVVVCGKCGKNIQRMVTKGMDYLHCTKGGCCAMAKLEYVEQAAMAAVGDRLEQLRTEAAGSAPADNASDEALLQTYDKELAKLDARLPRLHEFLEDGTYDRATFRARLDALNKEKSSLLEMQAAVKMRMRQREEADLSRAIADLENLLDLYPTLDAAGKNKLLKSTFRKITYYKEKKTKPRDFQLVFDPLHFVW